MPEDRDIFGVVEASEGLALPTLPSDRGWPRRTPPLGRTGSRGAAAELVVALRRGRLGRWRHAARPERRPGSRLTRQRALTAAALITTVFALVPAVRLMPAPAERESRPKSQAPERSAQTGRYDGAVIQQRARRGELVPCALQARDVELIAAVQRHKFLTAPQLLELWWPDGAADVGRRRLRRLWAAGHLDRFRPVAARGSFPWTYQLGREGHRLLQSVSLLRHGQRYETREVYDYRYVLHEIHLNSWVIAWRRLLDTPPVAWLGETQIQPPRGLRAAQLRLEDHVSVEGLHDRSARPLRPDGVLELTRRDRMGTRTFLIEYDRTRRVDKNFDKFRRYDSFLCWWWRHTEYGEMDQLPWAIFVCQDEQQRGLFLEQADCELTGHLWSPSLRPTEHQFVGRERTLFVSEQDVHRGLAIAYRVPPFPPGHSGRRDEAAACRGIRLPGATGLTRR